MSSPPKGIDTPFLSNILVILSFFRIQEVPSYSFERQMYLMFTLFVSLNSLSIHSIFNIFLDVRSLKFGLHFFFHFFLLVEFWYSNWKGGKEGKNMVS